MKLFRKIAVRGALLGMGFILLASCGQQSEMALDLRLYPEETLVIEANAYSCFMVVTGLYDTNGGLRPADVTGPVVTFNKFEMTWRKSTKLYVHSAILKLRGNGISGGEAKCNLTTELAPLFENGTAADPSIYTGGAFIAPGTITSNPKCRIPCSIPLANSDVPEISATGELVVKGTEVINEGTQQEVNYRVRSRITVRVIP